MSRLERVLSLGFANRRLLAEALFCVSVVRLALWVVPFGRVLRAAERIGRARSESRPVDVDRIVWAVEATSRRVPRATCLTQALAAKVLLGRGGVASVIHIGVAREKGRGIEGHAWLECGGKIIVGNDGVERYVEMGTWQANDV